MRRLAVVVAFAGALTLAVGVPGNARSRHARGRKAVQQAGGRALARDMFNGAEGYLEMWERAFGVPHEHCLAGTGRLRRGLSFQSVLYAAGQPLSRGGNAYRYCLSDGRRATVIFDRGGRVARVIARR